MPTSKLNRIGIYLSAFIIILLILFAVLRDNSEFITLSKANEILSNKSVQKVIVSKEYVYLKTADSLFKIASSQVTPKMFVDYKVEISNESNIVIYILFIILFLGLVSFLFRFWQKKEGISFSLQGMQKETPMQTASHTSESLQATKSDVSF
ncbi:MAG: hypothetical protein Q9M40_11775 [Sulfurimonas sp.]|nr:hypothetical protein [Sulfurimonas sp.]